MATPFDDAPMVLPGADDPALSVEDRHWLFSWQKDRADGFRHISGGIEQSLSVLRKYRPVVLNHLCRENLEVHSIAMRRGWLVDASEMAARRNHDDAAQDHVSRSAADAIAAMPNIKGNIAEAVSRAAAAQLKAAQDARMADSITKARDADPAVQRARAAKTRAANTNEPLVEGEILPPDPAAATVSGAAWRPPWED
jgi:hypothetical protein